MKLEQILLLSWSWPEALQAWSTNETGMMSRQDAERLCKAGLRRESGLAALQSDGMTRLPRGHCTDHSVGSEHVSS